MPSGRSVRVTLLDTTAGLDGAITDVHNNNDLDEKGGDSDRTQLLETLLEETDREFTVRAIPPTSVLEGDTGKAGRCEAATGDWRQQILRYVQVKDRFSALASLLLKSRAYYEVCNESQQLLSPPHHRPAAAEENGSARRMGRAIAQLPRSQYNKPYIPIQSSSHESRLRHRLSVSQQQNFYPMSISHQHPFAGMIRVVDNNSGPTIQLEATANKNNNHHPTVFAGFDIVVFDEINVRMYDTVQDFVHVFRDNFSVNDFQYMEDRRNFDSDNHQLRELYLRWAIKEAYTKALGVGMGFDFGSFETVLDDVSAGSSLWTYVTSPLQQHCDSSIFQTTGTVVFLTNNKVDKYLARPLREHWSFFFVPLYRDSSRSNMVGCGCGCFGPLSDLDGSLQDCVEIEWTSLQKLINWHK
jgi:phosphopantetheinyl transferase (holo-ACP synthase)